MPRCTVLVVEDDTAIRRGLVDSLRYAGYEVLECDNGSRAVEMAAESAIDLVLLDVMLPGINGFEALEAIRRSNATLPAIMVTARGSESDRIRGLREGADDYVVKPFSARELLARVEAVLRRSPERACEVRRLHNGSCEVDLERREVRHDDGTLRQLTERETTILHYLAANGGRAVARDELLQRVWGLNPRGIHTRTVDMHIARLREKVERDPSSPKMVVTVRGKGYMMGEGIRTGSDEASGEEGSS